MNSSTKKISFLSKLYKERKLQFVPPSEAIKDSYLSKSESNLVSAKILLDNQRIEESVSLAYYSMYHMLTALLFQVGIKCENHNASIILLNILFEIDSTDISRAKEERIDTQYYVDFKISRQDAAELIQTAEDFNKNLFDFTSKMTNEKTLNYRQKLQSIL